MSTNDPLICEVCEGLIQPGAAVVLGQESDGGDVLGPRRGADGRLAMFHEEHWPMRVGGLDRTRPGSRQGTLDALKARGATVP